MCVFYLCVMCQSTLNFLALLSATVEVTETAGLGNWVWNQDTLIEQWPMFGYNRAVRFASISDYTHDYLLLMQVDPSCCGSCLAAWTACGSHHWVWNFFFLRSSHFNLVTCFWLPQVPSGIAFTSQNRLNDENTGKPQLIIRTLCWFDKVHITPCLSCYITSIAEEII